MSNVPQFPTRILPLTGSEAQRSTAAASVLPNEIHTTNDQKRLFLENLPLVSVYHGPVADQAARLALHSSSPRGCWPNDSCFQIDNGTLCFCIANNGTDNAEWHAVTLGGGAGDVVGPASAVDGRIAVFNGTTGKLVKQSTGLAAAASTLSSTGSLTLAAGGTNQPVILSPSGASAVLMGLTSPVDSGGVQLQGTAYPVIRIERVNAAINVPLATFRVVARSTGDMSDGFGAHFDFTIRDTAGVDNGIGGVGCERNGADNTGRLYFRVASAGTTATRGTLDASGNLAVTGNIRTAAPAGGTSATARVGRAHTVSPTSPNRTIELEIDGTTYYLAAKTTND